MSGKIYFMQIVEIYFEETRRAYDWTGRTDGDRPVETGVSKYSPTCVEWHRTAEYTNLKITAFLFYSFFPKHAYSFTLVSMGTNM